MVYGLRSISGELVPRHVNLLLIQKTTAAADELLNEVQNCRVQIVIFLFDDVASLINSLNCQLPLGFYIYILCVLYQWCSFLILLECNLALHTIVRNGKTQKVS